VTERCAGIQYPLQVRTAGKGLRRLPAGISNAGYYLRYGYGKLAGKRVARHFVIMALQYMCQRFGAQVPVLAKQLFAVLHGQLPDKRLLYLLQPTLGICQQEEGLQPLGFVEMDVGVLRRCGNGFCHNIRFYAGAGTKKAWRSTYRSEVLAYPATDKRAHAVAWAFCLSSRCKRKVPVFRARFKANASNDFMK